MNLMCWLWFGVVCGIVALAFLLLVVWPALNVSGMISEEEERDEP